MDFGLRVHTVIELPGNVIEPLKRLGNDIFFV